MSSVPAHPAATHATAASPFASSRKRWIIISICAAVVLGLGAWFLFASMGQREPRLNENTVVLAKFIANSSNFAQLPFEKQRQYYKVMDNRDKELDQAFEQGQITEGEYRAGIEASWLGKHISRFEKYATLPPAGKANYINTLLNEKDKKDQKKEKEKKGSKKSTPAPEKIKVDETAAELRVESWPPAVREQWNLFHNAYRQEKKSREEKAAATSPAKSG